jgi:hypothetical protein
MTPAERIQRAMEQIMRLTLARANAEVALGDAAAAVDRAQGAFDGATRRLNELDAGLRAAQRALYEAVDDAGGGVSLAPGLGFATSDQPARVPYVTLAAADPESAAAYQGQIIETVDDLALADADGL